jgi:hypothetical protein
VINLNKTLKDNCLLTKTKTLAYNLCLS